MRIGPIAGPGRPIAVDQACGRRGIEIVPAATEDRGDAPRTPTAHVLVCIAGEASDHELIRQGRVLADLLSARLTVLYAFRLGGNDRRRGALRDDRAYARGVSAQLVELPVYSEAEGIAEYARGRGVTHVVIRETQSPDTLVERLGDVDWYLVLDQNGCTAEE